jgi:hypothetical protein
MNLVAYVVRSWPLRRPEAARLLREGKINVNGKVWAYPDVPKDILTLDQRGNYRIMVEGMPDPRSPGQDI